jgi:hypothetical protein
LSKPQINGLIREALALLSPWSVFPPTTSTIRYLVGEEYHQGQVGKVIQVQQLHLAPQ